MSRICIENSMQSTRKRHFPRKICLHIRLFRAHVTWELCWIHLNCSDLLFETEFLLLETIFGMHLVEHFPIWVFVGCLWRWLVPLERKCRINGTDIQKLTMTMYANENQHGRWNLERKIVTPWERGSEHFFSNEIYQRRRRIQCNREQSICITIHIWTLHNVCRGPEAKSFIVFFVADNQLKSRFHLFCWKWANFLPYQ